MHKEPVINEIDLQHLQMAIALARSAREHGNHPFGALLVDEHKTVLLEAENTVVTERDCTGQSGDQFDAQGVAAVQQ